MEIEMIDPGFYDELRAYVARHMVKNERHNHTLQPTEVVHEALLRLSLHKGAFANPAHLRATGIRAAHQVLVDYARQRSAQKRGGQRDRTTLVDGHAIQEELSLDILDLEAALDKLGARWPRQREVALLRLWCMTGKEIGQVLGIQDSTVKTHWQFARAFLRRELGDREEAEER